LLLLLLLLLVRFSAEDIFSLDGGGPSPIIILKEDEAAGVLALGVGGDLAGEGDVLLLLFIDEVLVSLVGGEERRFSLEEDL